jgi:hypothetical protein
VGRLVEGKGPGEGILQAQGTEPLGIVVEGMEGSRHKASFQNWYQ